MDTVDRIGDVEGALFNSGQTTNPDKSRQVGADLKDKLKRESNQVMNDGDDLSQVFDAAERQQLAASVESDHRPTGSATMMNKSID